MNTRCYRCGWSFSLSRETIETAVANAGTQKIHVEHCPRCRQAIKIPMQQLRRTLPPGWTPETQPAVEADSPGVAASEAPAAAAQAPAPVLEAAPVAAATRKRTRRGKARETAAEAATHLEEEASPAHETETLPRPTEPSAAGAPAAKTRKPTARKQPKS